MRRLLLPFLVVCSSCAPTPRAPERILSFGTARDTTTEKITIEPRYTEARLAIGSHSLAPLRVFERAEHPVGTHIFDLDETPDGQRVWSVSGDADRAYVLTYEIDEAKEFKRYDPVPRVRVYDLIAREWNIASDWYRWNLTL